MLNPFLSNILILYSLKTPENNQRFSGVAKGFKIGASVRNGLISMFQTNALIIFMCKSMFFVNLNQSCRIDIINMSDEQDCNFELNNRKMHTINFFNNFPNFSTD